MHPHQIPNTHRNRPGVSLTLKRGDYLTIHSHNGRPVQRPVRWTLLRNEYNVVFFLFGFLPLPLYQLSLAGRNCCFPCKRRTAECRAGLAATFITTSAQVNSISRRGPFSLPCAQQHEPKSPHTRVLFPPSFFVVFPLLYIIYVPGLYSTATTTTS